MSERFEKAVYHVVCHGCPFEEIFERDRVGAQVAEFVHQERTGHAVERAEISGGGSVE